MFVPYASEIWTKSYGLNYTTYRAFWQNGFFFNKHFWQRFDAILEDISVAEIIVQCKTIILKTITFQCAKNYGSQTLVTKLKIAPNMADPISFNEIYRSLKDRGMGCM